MESICRGLVDEGLDSYLGGWLRRVDSISRELVKEGWTPYLGGCLRRGGLHI